MLDESRAWRKVGELDRKYLGNMVDADYTTLWGVGCSSSSGRNDCVETSDVDEFSDSLRLVHVENLTVVVRDYPSESGTRRRVQGRFRLDEASMRCGSRTKNANRSTRTLNPWKRLSVTDFLRSVSRKITKGVATS